MYKIHTEDKIIKLLLENRKEFTIRSIANSIKVDYKTVHIKVDELAKQGIISIKKAGQSSLCSLNNILHPSILRAEYIRIEELLKNKNMYVLYNRIKEINPFFILLLFGSHASKTNKKTSDIDLMLISDIKTEKIQKTITSIPLNIHLLKFNTEEFSQMLKTTEFNVGKEAANNNIILFGIENYYRMIENAGPKKNHRSSEQHEEVS